MAEALKKLQEAESTLRWAAASFGGRKKITWLPTLLRAAIAYAQARLEHIDDDHYVDCECGWGGGKERTDGDSDQDAFSIEFERRRLAGENPDETPLDLLDKGRD